MTYDAGSGIQTVVLLANGTVEIPIEALPNPITVKGQHHWSGDITLDMRVKTVDHDEDNSAITVMAESVTVSTLSIKIDPDADPSILNVGQASGDEDAGRVASGVDKGKITVASAQNGIKIDVKGHLLDTDGSESFTFKIKDIPEDAAIFYDGVIYTDPTPNAGTTWTFEKTNFDNTKPLTFIPPHNSNVDVKLTVGGDIVDSITFAGDTNPTVSTTTVPDVVTTVKLKGVADVISGNEIHLYDIKGDADGHGGLKNVLVDKTKTGIYSAVHVEDEGNAANQKGADFNLKEIFEDVNKINSYDNTYDNDPDQNVTTGGTNASETLTVTLTGLDAKFDVVGATLTGGSGSSRVWVMIVADIKNGNVHITTKEHFSGEINFKLEYVTTEDDGSTLTSPATAQDVTLLVTPKAEGTTTILQAHTDINEDILTHLDFANQTTLPDGDETLSALGILKADVYDGTNPKDFTIYVGNSTTTTLEQASGTSGSGVILSTNGDYYMIDLNVAADLYVQYNQDIGGEESTFDANNILDTTFHFKYDVTDAATGHQAGNVTPLTDTQTALQNDALYTLTLTPVTDGVTTTVNNGKVTDDITSTISADIDVDPNNKHNVDINTATVIKVKIHIDGIDTEGNGVEGDSSEMIKHIKVEGVPEGIGIEHGRFIGNVVGQPTDGIWYVDIPQADIIKMDGTADQTYILQFHVSDNYINYQNSLGTSESTIKIKVIDQEYDTNGGEVATAVESEIDLKFTRDTNFSGSTNDAPMDIIGLTDVNNDGTVDEKDGYAVKSTFTGFKEDPVTGK